jgi:hypothetical protein
VLGVVLCTFGLVHSLLRARLSGVRLELASDESACQCKNSCQVTYRATRSIVEVPVSLSLVESDFMESGVKSSLSLVERSLRPSEDMMKLSD